MFYMDLVERIKEFMENEARSCSMDFGCIHRSMCFECGEEKWH